MIVFDLACICACTQVEIKQLFFKEKKNQTKNGTATKVKHKPFCNRSLMSRNINFVSKAYLSQSITQVSQSVYELLYSYILTQSPSYLDYKKLQLWMATINFYRQICFFNIYLTEECLPNDYDFLKNRNNRIIWLKNRSAAIITVL